MSESERALIYVLLSGRQQKRLVLATWALVVFTAALCVVPFLTTPSPLRNELDALTKVVERQKLELEAESEATSKMFDQQTNEIKRLAAAGK